MDLRCAVTNSDIKIMLIDLSFFYGAKPVLRHIRADFTAHSITAVVGPSGQGKSTLLTVFNRLWEEIPGARLTGEVKIRLDDRLDNHRHGRSPTDRPA